MSLYLKYRPTDFNGIVGQGFVKETLKKAIENGNTVGAYLFCGPRGTGKTSSARIFAKAINCENPNKGDPCLKCNICTDFADNKLMDIIEMDAASVTGVENIREIIEKAKFSTNITKYKVYIIDEVHMLSNSAFNALLKILEEPPSHVKFILATTETHKVPDTIISRCQRYDFKRISNNDIRDRLLYIAKNENVEIDNKSLNYIINNSGGGLRNAISLFEQLIFDGKISYDNIVNKLEIVDENTIELFFQKLLNNDVSVIQLFEKIINEGKNIKLFIKDIIYYTKNKSLIELGLNNDISKYINILDTLDEAYIKTKNSLDENTTFLIGILKILNGDGVSIKKKLIETESQQEKKHTKQEIIDETKKEISHDDINNIFGEDTTNFENKNEKVEKKEIKNNNTEKFENNIEFDKSLLLEILKKHGVKGGVIITIKSGKITFEGNDFILQTGNKFQKKLLEDNNILQILTKSLNEMGILNVKIKIN